MATVTSSTTLVTIQQVLDEELAQVDHSRKLRLGGDSASAKDNLIGLAFSGGGIRSATFNLGILQALARQRLLRTFDYVSTVSGGGYIGSWLMAWMHHQQIGIKEVEDKLSAPAQAPQQAGEVPEVHFLRNYSNYLTPRKGILGADFWAFVAAYLRNTLLNQAILVLALLSVLLLPRAFVYGLHLVEMAARPVQSMVVPEHAAAVIPLLSLLLGTLMAALAVLCIGYNLASMDAHNAEGVRNSSKEGEYQDPWYTKPWAVHSLVVIPLLLSAAYLTFAVGKAHALWDKVRFPEASGPLLGLMLYVWLWAFALLFRSIRKPATDVMNRANFWLLGTATFSGLLTGFLFIPFARILVPLGKGFDPWRAMTFGVPLMVGMMLITGVLHIGLMGNRMPDTHREWWGRLGGLLMIYSTLWCVLFLIAVYFPYGAHWTYQQFTQKGSLGLFQGLTVSGVAVWLASTAYGVIFGKSERSGISALDAPTRKKLMHYAARATPYIFIVGWMLGLSLLANHICAWFEGSTATWFPSDQLFSWKVPLACVVLLAAGILLSWRVDINEFSIHYLYRNRLVRCYMGASAPDRHQQPFTGFSEKDDFSLTDLAIPADSRDAKHGRPLPILNTSLNVVRGKELAVQTRKARAFAFTPVYGGFTRQETGSREWKSFFGTTSDAMSKSNSGGISLGTAMAISGAAASPNMGSYSEPSLAFLMTLFDVRLGWWIGHPIRTSSLWPLKFEWWKRGSPLFGFGCLVCELMGNARDDGRFLYLSDGGHFENLAIYELVRRKCKLIVACDASCDGSGTLSDLHNAMERCRTDFGVNITFDDENPVRPAGDDGVLRSQVHFLKGEIDYPGSHEKGTIIYIKSTVTLDDPKDVLAYADANRHFPHDTIANQWFDEAHFENYRALGEAAGNSAMESIKTATDQLLVYPKPGLMKAAA